MSPGEDLEGKKDAAAYARYFSLPTPAICLYSLAETLSFKQPADTKKADIEQGLADALSCGMTTEQIGSRWVCRWDKERLRRFVVEHVLLHEVGHHVYSQQRALAGFGSKTSARVKEQFAEDYAFRHQRK